MAFLDSTPYVVGPVLQVQEDPLARNYGIGGRQIGYRTRTTYEYRLTWPVDNTGGEAVPETYTAGDDEFRLVSTSYDLGYGGLSGHLTGTYRLLGDWSTVWEEIVYAEITSGSGV
jgi:hypothetical protein